MSGKAWALANMFKKVAEPSPVDVAGWLGALRLGTAQKMGELELWPLVHPHAVADPDLMAAEAIKAGLLDVQEKDGGVVQELMATNRAPKPVILFEGEVLLGAKQNRMIAHTIVIAPGATVVVPVGCVEQGRWYWATRHFDSSDRVADSSMRRVSKPSVMHALRHYGSARLNQGILWSEVDAVSAREAVTSETGDYAAVLRKRAAEEEAFAAGVKPVDRQVGMMAVREGVLLALDVVGSSGTWQGVSHRFVRSLVPESKPGMRGLPARRKSAPDWLGSLCSARIERRPAVGLGHDVTLADDGLIGSGVWLGDRPAHISVFLTH